MAQSNDEIKIISARVVNRNRDVKKLDPSVEKPLTEVPMTSNEAPVGRRSFWSEILRVSSRASTEFLREMNFYKNKSD
ncbi:MAG: hypothetical protein IT289_00895 [Oligoflexia bacterium]|nr:hypothetical protein [Oligoflexia bacterium]